MWFSLRVTVNRIPYILLRVYGFPLMFQNLYWNWKIKVGAWCVIWAESKNIAIFFTLASLLIYNVLIYTRQTKKHEYRWCSKCRSKTKFFLYPVVANFLQFIIWVNPMGCLGCFQSQVLSGSECQVFSSSEYKILTRYFYWREIFSIFNTNNC